MTKTKRSLTLKSRRPQSASRNSPRWRKNGSSRPSGRRQDYFSPGIRFGNDRIGHRGDRAGASDPHLRGRGVRHSHRLDGPGLMGAHKDLVCPIAAAPTRSAPATSPMATAIAGAAVVRSPFARNAVPRNDLTGNDRIRPTTATAFWWTNSAISCKTVRALDVVVFHYPGGCGEELHQAAGGVAERNRSTSPTAPCGSRSKERAGRDEQIARKPPEKLLAMLEPVFDNDCLRGKWERRLPEAMERDGLEVGTRGRLRRVQDRGQRRPTGPGCGIATWCLRSIRRRGRCGRKENPP